MLKPRKLRKSLVRMDTFSTVVVAMSSTNESSAAVDGAAKLMGFVLHLRVHSLSLSISLHNENGHMKAIEQIRHKTLG